jgi:methyl-accepting chemotaxis protein
MRRRFEEAPNDVGMGTSEVSSNIVGVKDAVVETGRVSKDVLSALGALSHQAEQLRDEVDRFLGSVRAA